VHHVDEELFLRSPGGSHEESLLGLGPRVPMVSHPKSTYCQDARAGVVVATMELSVRRQLPSIPGNHRWSC